MMYQLGRLDGFQPSPDFPDSERAAFWEWFQEHYVRDDNNVWRLREVVEARREFAEVDYASVRELDRQPPHERKWWPFKR